MQALSRPSPRCAIPVLATVMALVFLVACTSGEGVPLLERRAQELNKSIMCPPCPGESIDQSQHAVAADMRAIVMEKLEEGWTEVQIQAYFVEAYGPRILLEPPREGFNILVWLVPPVGLAFAAVVLYLGLRMMLRSKALQEGGPLVPLSAQERAGYFRRVQLALDDEASGGGSGDSPASEAEGGK